MTSARAEPAASSRSSSPRGWQPEAAILAFVEMPTLASRRISRRRDGACVPVPRGELAGVARACGEPVCESEVGG